MKREDENNRQSTRIPENDPSKAMDSKKEVEQSKDNRTDQDFPGYPHYPAREDILDGRNDYSREDMNVEDLPGSQNNSGVGQRFMAGQDRDRAEEAMTPGPGTPDELHMREGTGGDVNEDDLAALNASNDEIGRPQNVSNEEEVNSDLDVPGSELDDANERIGEEDEENNYYSLGGERQEANEEDPNSGPNRGG